MTKTNNSIFIYLWISLSLFFLVISLIYFYTIIPLQFLPFLPMIIIGLTFILTTLLISIIGDDKNIVDTDVI